MTILWLVLIGGKRVVFPSNWSLTFVTVPLYFLLEMWQRIPKTKSYSVLVFQTTYKTIAAQYLLTSD